MHRSTDLVHWERVGYALEPVDGDHWAQTDLWAPEVMYWHGVFHMYVSATRLGPDGHGVEELRRQGLARSTTPEGPYRFDDEPLVRDAWSIDGHPFQDEDGTLWLFYNTRTEATRRDGRPGSGIVADRLLAPDRLEGAPSEVAFPSEPWEGSFAGDAFWNEASWVLKRRGRYHHLYSGGFYAEASYGIGLTSADRVRGPWRKDPLNPILHSGGRIAGPGHHSTILGPDGVTAYAVYHGYVDGAPGRKVHLDPVRWCGDRPVIGTDLVQGRPTEGPQPLPPTAVLDPAVPYWHADGWVGGSAVTVAGVRVALPGGPGPARVRAGQNRDGLRVWVDGRLAAQAPGPHPPAALEGVDGDVVAATLTSHLEDEAVRWLGPGERRAWAWGGTGPAEVLLAVRGACAIEAGGVATTARSPEDRFALARLALPAGAQEVVVTGLELGARVTDLVISARPAPVS